METREFYRGNVILLKRPLADFICIIQRVEGERLQVRYLDSPPNDPGVMVKVGEIIKLADAQERELPTQFIEAIERQRQVVFKPKPTIRQPSLSSVMKGVGEDVYAQILKILVEDGEEIND